MSLSSHIILLLSLYIMFSRRAGISLSCPIYFYTHGRIYISAAYTSQLAECPSPSAIIIHTGHIIQRSVHDGPSTLHCMISRFSGHSTDFPTTELVDYHAWTRCCIMFVGMLVPTIATCMANKYRNRVMLVKNGWMFSQSPTYIQ